MTYFKLVANRCGYCSYDRPGRLSLQRLFSYVAVTLRVSDATRHLPFGTLPDARVSNHFLASVKVPDSRCLLASYTTGVNPALPTTVSHIITSLFQGTVWSLTLIQRALADVRLIRCLCCFLDYPVRRSGSAQSGDRRTDGRMDGWTDGRTDRWTDRRLDG